MKSIDIKGKINEIIKRELRPIIQGDGGDIEFLDFDKPSGVVSVRFHGHCVGCPMSQATLKQGIERWLREKIPAVKEVVAEK